MRRLLITFSFLVFVSNTVRSQCSFGGTNSGITVTPTSTSQFTSNINGGRYFMMNVVSGGNYTVRTCGLASWDTQLTVYTSTGTYVAYNDDSCGLRSQVNFTSPITGQVRVILNRYY